MIERVYYKEREEKCVGRVTIERKRYKKIKLLCVHSESELHAYYIHTKFSLFGAVIFDI